MSSAQVRVALEDVFGRGIAAPVRVTVVRPPTERAAIVDVDRVLTISGLEPASYRLRLEPKGYRGLDVDLELHRGNELIETRCSFTIPSERVQGITAPTYGALDQPLRTLLARSVSRSRHSAAEWYEGLPDEQKANLLNVYAQALATTTATGGSVVELFQSLKRVNALNAWFGLEPAVIDSFGPPAFTELPATRPSRRVVESSEGSTRLGLVLPSSPSRAVAGVRVLGATGSNPYEIGQALAIRDLRPNYLINLAESRESPRGSVSGHLDLSRDLLEIGGPSATAINLESSVTTPSSAPPLSANHWIEDESETTQSLDGPVLFAGHAYWYWFEVSERPRDHATRHEFEAARQLDSAPQSTLTLEVRSTLLPDKLERRRVTYVRGAGLGAQSFALEASAGSHELLCQLILRNEVIYSRKWVLVVDRDPASDRPEGVEALRGVSGGTSRAEAGADPRDSLYRLVVDHNRGEVELTPPGARRLTQPLGVGLDGLNKMSAEMRQKLNAFARRPPGPDGVPSAEDARAFLQDVSKWGTEAFDAIFDPQPGGQLSQALRAMPRDALLQIDGDPISFPWEWIFLGTPEDIDRADEQRSRFLEGFIGCRFAVTILPRTHHDLMNRSPRLLNGDATHLLASVNPTTDATGGPSTKTFLEGIASKHAGLTARTCIGRDATVTALQDMAASMPHLLYFYAHHRSGAQMNELGFTGFGKATLYLKGRDEEPLSQQDLRFNVKLPPFAAERAPLVFINACGTAQGSELYPSGFIPYFATQLGAPGVLGTHAEIPAVNAYQFACEFFKRWFAGAMLGDAVREIRTEWMERLNPFAMYYTAHGSCLLRLDRSL